MSTLKTNQLTHLGNTGTANVIMTNTGNTTLANDLIVGDNINVGNNVTITGTASVGSTLDVTGNLTCNGATVSFTGANFNLTGANLSSSATSVTLSGTDTITMDNYTLGTNSKGNRYVNTSSATGGSDGDIWYEVA